MCEVFSKRDKTVHNHNHTFQIMLVEFTPDIYLQQMVWSSGKVLGGSGFIGYLHHVRGSRYDFDEWAEEGAEGWSYKDVLPYFIKSERIEIPELKKSRKYKHYILTYDYI